MQIIHNIQKIKTHEILLIVQDRATLAIFFHKGSFLQASLTPFSHTKHLSFPPVFWSKQQMKPGLIPHFCIQNSNNGNCILRGICRQLPLQMGTKETLNFSSIEW